jgi:hypothetical protein
LGLLVAVFFLGAKIFALWQPKKEKKSIANCLKGFLGEKKTQNSTHFEGKKKVRSRLFHTMSSWPELGRIPKSFLLSCLTCG